MCSTTKWQVSGWAWVEEALPNIKIEPLLSLFLSQPLEISAANGMVVPFACVDLEICSKSHGHANKQVPILISQTSATCPLLGSDVNTEMIKENKEQVDITAIVKEARSSCESTVETLISVLQILAPEETPPLCELERMKI